MKRFITILFVTVSLVFIPIVKVNADKNNWTHEDFRTVSISMQIEKNILHIYSTKQWDNIGIQMIDPNGRTIYIDVITIPTEEELTIPFSYLPEGNYQVILTKDNQPVVWYLSK